MNRTKWALTKAWYHVFQFVLTRAMYLLPWRSPQIVEGPGSVRTLPALVRAKKISRVLVVTDATLHRLGLLDGMLAAAREAGLTCAVYDGVEPNPSIENIEAARKMYLESRCEGIIAFGGGSSMDCAKACGARIVRPRTSVNRLGGQLRVLLQIPPLFAVPTTAGTGSETTIAAVVTDRETHHKYAVNDPVLIPLCAVLDPELTLGLPPHITAATGMDALTHAVEAYTNRYAPKYTQRLSEEAAALIFQNLESVYRDGKQADARLNMLYASFKAGAAFTRACVGYVHAIAHTLGGLYGTPHGLANAVILPIVMEDFGPAIYPRLARLAELTGVQGDSEAERAQGFIREIRRMNRDMGIPDHFDHIRDEDIPQMIRWALAEANPVYPVPVLWNEEQMEKTIRRVQGKA